MALQSEVSPPMVGDPNKDTQIEGDTKSDDDSSQSTDEDVDLEEGEILDSGEEAEEEKKDLTNSSLQEALGKDFLKDIEQLVSQAKSEIPVPAPNIISKNLSPHGSPHKKKRPSKYLDHDKFEDNSDHEDGWYSPSRKHKSSKFDAPIDYRKELEAYRGTPPSSPDSKHREKKKKRSSKKSKKSSKKAIKRKDIKGEKVRRYIKEANKFRICKFFKDGNCAKGADCGFSHATPKSFKKKELCKFYLSGHCNKGSDCIYMHGEFPCKFYHTGSECYAKDACRFSHAPLTEETQRILDDYLNINRGDDDYHDHRDHHDHHDRKRRSTPSPEPKEPPPKRVCLLGSPPRHIREAEETKRWQEEMLMQQQNHPGFKININAQRDGLSPPPFSRPNFYQETLPDTPSPKKKRANPDTNLLPMNFNPPLSGSGYPVPKIEPSVPSPDDNFIYEEDYLDMEDEAPNIKQEPPDIPDFNNWTDMHAMEQNMPAIKKEPFDDTNQPDLDFTSDVKFEETTQFSELESSVDCNASSPPNSSEIPAIAIKKEIIEDNEYDDSNHEDDKSEEKIPNDVSPVQEPAPPPVVIPSHLPKKQQELFKRIFQHQKKTEMAASASDASNSPKSYDNPDPVVKETEETIEKNTEKTEPSVWYSSEDDDDDDDSIEPLTDVLKKLQKEPPVTQLPSKVETKPAASLMAMINKIQQNTQQKNRGVQETQQSDFFKNLLHGNISSNDSLQLPGLNTPFSEPMRPALLPNPQPVVKKEPVNAPKDPRLKNRDPRTLASAVSNVNLPKTLEQTPLQTSSSLISSAVKTPTILSTSSVTSESTIDVPYKLRGIYTKPPNYTPYINASQSNPNLLKDPRLRKHLNLQHNENGMETKRDADSVKSLSKEIPPMPKLLLAYDKNSLNINIFESNPAPKPNSEESQDIKPFIPKILDPRMRRRESQNSTGSSTPPHLSIAENLVPPPNKALNSFDNNIKIKEEKIWSPPVLENSWLPPVLEPSVSIKQEVDSDTDDPCRLEIDEGPQNSSSKVNEESPPVLKKNTVPTPASHLPRAIADPRMARLHNPLDSRRLRVGSSESSNKTAELSKVHLKQNSPPKEILSDASKASTSAAVVDDDSNSAKVLRSIPKKKSEKSEEKKKTVHRNRKSSMDYASPLNSCDDSNSNKGLNYNSYNQRQPRTSASHISSDSNNSTNLVIPETSSDFLSDNSNLECDNSSDVNLKDMFKTIDPTASPFC